MEIAEKEYRELQERLKTLEKAAEDRKHADLILQKHYRALKLLGKANHTLMHTPDERSLLQAICNIAVEAGYSLAWAGYAENDENKTVRPVSHSGDKGGYLASIDISWADTERGRGPTGTAIRTGKPTICKSSQDDPHYALWQKAAKESNLGSSIALPLVIDGRSIGALNIYAKEPDAFDSEEVKVLTDLADDLAYGISAIRCRTEQITSKDNRRIAETKYRNIMDNMLEGFQVISPDWRYIYLNDTAAAHSKKSREELLGKTMMEVYPGIERTDMFARLKECMEKRTSHKMENEFAFPDGAKGYFELCIAPVPEGVFVLSLDITERKLAEEQLKKKLAELERYYNVTMGREDRVIELKREIKELKKRLGEA
jgi:PAS domain S-box-containing protein